MTIERTMFPPVDPTRRHFLSNVAGTTARAAADPVLLRVGSLELDLTNQTAKRGDRSIDLLPREFRLLTYMMQRSGQLLTLAMLLEEVWNYKFIPQTNTVAVHMSKLRRKVDGSNEAPMIRNVRGAGFILSATLTDGVLERRRPTDLTA